VPSLCHLSMMSRGTLSRAATSSVVKGRSDSALAASPDSDRSTGAISVGGQSDLGQDHNVAIAQSSTYRSSRPTPSRQQRDYPPHPAPSSAFVGERRLDLGCFQPHILSACRFPIGFDFDGPRRARNVGNSAPTVLLRVVIHWMAADSMAPIPYDAFDRYLPTWPRATALGAPVALNQSVSDADGHTSLEKRRLLWRLCSGSGLGARRGVACHGSARSTSTRADGFACGLKQLGGQLFVPAGPVAWPGVPPHHAISDSYPTRPRAITLPGSLCWA
jgi:hypothetical protein